MKTPPRLPLPVIAVAGLGLALVGVGGRAHADCADARVLVVACDVTLTRAQGGPPTTSIPYSVPTTGGLWLVEVLNGPGGAPTADQLIVTLDGVDVVRTPDLHPDWRLIRVGVAPAASGTMAVRIGSAPGATVRIRVLGVVPREAAPPPLGTPVVLDLAAFGPATFSRLDPPAPQVATFTVPLDGLYWLTVADAGIAPLTSIVATVDGLAALHPSDAPGPPVVRSVLVAGRGGTSTLSAEVRGDPGAAASIRIAGYGMDAVPPTIEVITPEPGVWQGPHSSERGGGLIELVYGDDFALALPESFQAFVGATDVTPAFTIEPDGAWARLADLPLAEGANAFRTAVCDRAGSPATADFTILWDSRGPEIAVNVKPNVPESDPQVVRSRIPTVGIDWRDPLPGVGELAAVQTLHVLLDGVDQTDQFTFSPGAVGADWHLAREEALPPGEHVVEVEVADALGNVGRTTHLFRIEVDPAVRLAIQVPPAPDVPLVAGEFYDLSVIALTESDAPAEAYAGTVRLSIPPESRGTLDGFTIAFTVDDFGALTVPDQALFLTAGPHRVTATDIENSALTGQLDLVVAPGPPTSLVALSGAEDQNLFGGQAPLPVVVEVRDAFGNLVPDSLVRFSAGGASADALTGPDGRAILSLGPLAAIGTFLATVSIVGSGVEPVAFTLAVGGATVRGFVLDAATEQVVPGATISASGVAAEATSDVAGRFVLQGLPVGPGRLSTQAPGYVPAIVPVVVAEGTTRVVIRLAPRDDSSVFHLPRGRDTLTLVPMDWTSASGVRLMMAAGVPIEFASPLLFRADVVPATAFAAPPPPGLFASFAVDFGPDGAIFPEGALTVYVPNLDGLAPGSTIVLRRFDETTLAWVDVPGATATVEPDGSYVRIDGLRSFSPYALFSPAPDLITIRGRVLDSRGRVVQGAQVMVVGVGVGATSGMYVVTTSQGYRAEFLGRLGYDYRLVATYQGTVGTETFVATAETSVRAWGSTVSAPDIRLPPFGVEFRGLVLLPAGGTLAGTVRAVGDTGTPVAGASPETIAGDGVDRVAYAIYLYQAPSRVAVRFAGTANGAAVEVSSPLVSPRPGVVDVPPILLGATEVVGHVVSPLGTPYVGASVHVTAVLGAARVPQAAATAATDGAGAYRVTLLGAFDAVEVSGSYLLAATVSPLERTAIFPAREAPGGSVALDDLILFRVVTPQPVHSGILDALAAGRAVHIGAAVDNEVGRSLLAAVPSLGGGPRFLQGWRRTGDRLPDIFAGGRRFSVAFDGAFGLAGQLVDIPGDIVGTRTAPPTPYAVSELGFDQGLERVPVDAVATGDVNGDGFSDLVLGASRYDHDAGRVWVLLGRAEAGSRDGIDQHDQDPYRWPTGNLDEFADVILHGGQVHDLHCDGEWPGSKLGASLAVGDVDADGFDDLVIGSPGYDPHRTHGSPWNHGRVYVVFGREAWAPGGALDGPFDVSIRSTTASALPRIVIEASAQFGADHHYDLGRSVALAQLDGDPHLELAIGADQFDNPHIDSAGRLVESWTDDRGAVVLYDLPASGRPALEQWIGGQGPAQVNFYGIYEVDLTATGWQTLPRREFPDTDPAVIERGRVAFIRGDAALDRFGWALAAIGDATGDRGDEILVGSPYWASEQGRVRILSVTTTGAGQPRFTENGEGAGHRFGWSVAPAGDQNGDDLPDFVVGAPHYRDPAVSNAPKTGAAYLYVATSSASWSRRVTYRGSQAGEELGYAVGSPGDISGDQVPDIVVGAPFWDCTACTPPRTDAGRFVVLSPYIGLVDKNGDGLYELDEAAIGTLDLVDDPDNDIDDDGLTNEQEVLWGTDPLNARFPVADLAPHVVTGRLVRLYGGALPASSSIFWHVDPLIAWPLSLFSTPIEPDGTFRMEIPFRPVRVDLRVTVFVPLSEEVDVRFGSFETDPDGETDIGVVAISDHPAILTGLVRDDRGVGVPGVAVSLEDTGDFFPVATTDSAGRYALPIDLRPDFWRQESILVRVVARTPERGSARVLASLPEAPDGAEIEQPPIQLVSPYRVTGRAVVAVPKVADVDGNGTLDPATLSARGAAITATLPNGTMLGPVTTAADGSFTLEVPYGTASVTLQASLDLGLGGSAFAASSMFLPLASANYPVGATISAGPRLLFRAATPDADGDGLTDTEDGAAAATPDRDGDGLGDLAEILLGSPISAPDQDLDHLVDGREYLRGTNPRVFDTDGDGLPDGYEDLTQGYDPTRRDSFGDGTPDGDEDRDGDHLTAMAEYIWNAAFDPGLWRLDADRLDSDGDGIADGYELPLAGFSPILADSDADGTPDGGEDPDADHLTTLAEYLWNAAHDAALWRLAADVFDSDGDGLPDGFETPIAGQSPILSDSDGDGIADGDEDPDGDHLTSLAEYAWNASNDSSLWRLAAHRFDSDGDGLPDGYELPIPGYSPIAADSDANGTPDGDEDPDGDHLTTLAEYAWNAAHDATLWRLAAHVFDTDGDGLPDGFEVLRSFLSPILADTDADATLDGAELAPDDTMTAMEKYLWNAAHDPKDWGLSAKTANTDGDPYSDAQEIDVYLTNPLVPTTGPLVLDVYGTTLPGGSFWFRTSLPLDPATVTTTTVRLLDADGNVVAATVLVDGNLVFVTPLPGATETPATVDIASSVTAPGGTPIDGRRSLVPTAAPVGPIVIPTGYGVCLALGWDREPVFSDVPVSFRAFVFARPHGRAVGLSGFNMALQDSLDFARSEGWLLLGATSATWTADVLALPAIRSQITLSPAVPYTSVVLSLVAVADPSLYSLAGVGLAVSAEAPVIMNGQLITIPSAGQSVPFIGSPFAALPNLQGTNMTTEPLDTVLAQGLYVPLNTDDDDADGLPDRDESDVPGEDEVRNGWLWLGKGTLDATADPPELVQLWYWPPDRPFSQKGAPIPTDPAAGAPWSGGILVYGIEGLDLSAEPRDVTVHLHFTGAAFSHPSGLIPMAPWTLDCDLPVTVYGIGYVDPSGRRRPGLEYIVAAPEALDQPLPAGAGEGVSFVRGEPGGTYESITGPSFREAPLVHPEPHAASGQRHIFADDVRVEQGWDPRIGRPSVSMDGLRVFPEPLVDDPDKTAPRDFVRGQIRLNVPVPFEVDAYITAYDIDDPFRWPYPGVPAGAAGDATVVDNDAQGSFAGQNVVLPLASPLDPRPRSNLVVDNIAEARGWPAAWGMLREGVLCAPRGDGSMYVGPYPERLHVRFAAYQTDPIVFYHHVTTAPGDNFRLVADMDPDMWGMNDDRQANDESWRIRFMAEPYGLEIPYQDLRSTPALTVWRTVHLELDAMTVPGTLSFPHDSVQSASIAAVDGQDRLFIRIRSGAAAEHPLDYPATAFMPGLLARFLDPPPPFPVIEAVEATKEEVLAISPMRWNGDRMVRVALRDPLSTTSFGVRPWPEAGLTQQQLIDGEMWVWLYDDDDSLIGDPDYWTTPGPRIRDEASPATFDGQPGRPPRRLIGETDVLELDTLFRLAYVRAEVVPNYAVNVHPDIWFEEHLEPDLALPNNRDLPGAQAVEREVRSDGSVRLVEGGESWDLRQYRLTDAFWVAQMVLAFQPQAVRDLGARRNWGDRDPDDEDTIFGRTPPHWSRGVIYAETIRDAAPAPGPGEEAWMLQSAGEARALARQLAHAIRTTEAARDVTPSESGLLSGPETAPSEDLFFDPMTIAWIRRYQPSLQEPDHQVTGQ